MRAVPIEEVNWGLAQERDVVQRWVAVSPLGKRAHRFVKSLEFDPYDVLVLDDAGVPLCVLEVKVRRVAFGEYGDVMAPIKKHEAALAWKAMNVPFLLVTAYACSTLTVVNLGEPPESSKLIARRDRPGMTPVMHGFWKGDQVEVLQ